ncbi:MAG: class I SAM-dependent methyltransferase [Gammaproteobacteria bacterium]|nr:class I SAM-dependent methyltransferase [Gammaproteobacteria bacterium]
MNALTRKNNPLNATNKMLKTIGEKPLGTAFLAFRDMSKIISKHIEGINALDFGCGAGRSSRMLKACGLKVTGVDISPQMIEQAMKSSEDIKYILIEKNCFKDIGEKYNLILISFVLMEMPSKQEIVMLIKNLSNVLAENGRMIIIVASDDLYIKNWLSIETNLYSNMNKNSGDIARVYLKDYQVTIDDYLWTESDCEECFKKSNMLIQEKLKPLGILSDGKNWVDEYSYAPFAIYVLSK